MNVDIRNTPSQPSCKRSDSQYSSTGIKTMDINMFLSILVSDLLIPGPLYTSTPPLATIVPACMVRPALERPSWGHRIQPPPPARKQRTLQNPKQRSVRYTPLKRIIRDPFHPRSNHGGRVTQIRETILDVAMRNERHSDSHEGTSPARSALVHVNNGRTGD